MRFFISMFLDNMEQELPPTRLIATDDLPAENLDYAWNRAYFCQQCGKVWCRWTLDQQDFVGDRYYAYHRSCPNHQWGGFYGDTPGSMLLCLKDIAVVPREVLEHELLNLMERK